MARSMAERSVYMPGSRNVPSSPRAFVIRCPRSLPMHCCTLPAPTPMTMFAAMRLPCFGRIPRRPCGFPKRRRGSPKQTPTPAFAARPGKRLRPSLPLRRSIGSVLSLKSVEELRKDRSRFFDSPPPNGRTFGAPFAQNDSRCFTANFKDRTIAARVMAGPVPGSQTV